MKKVDVQEAKNHLSDLLQRVEGGEKFFICRNGHPIAELVPHRRSSRNAADPFLSRVLVKGDLIKPVAEREWEAEA